MKYGAMNLPTKSVVEEIEELGKLGFDYIELTIDAPEATPEIILRDQDRITDTLAAHQLEIIGHLPTFISIADLYESIRKASIDENIKALEAGAALGIKKFVIHPGSIRGMGRQVKNRVHKYAHKSLATIVKKTNELQVTLCIENMFPGIHSLTEPYEFEKIFHKHPDLMFTLDIAHAHLGTNKNRSPDFIRHYAERLSHIHISDNFGKDDCHLPLGAGMIYFSRIFKELKDIGYDETITLEVFSRDRDYLSMSLSKIKRMWDSS
ncbi:MAG: sugar phosphate isomerase/epimerase family protein [Thermodesulfobacteriota bacterium]